MMTIKDKHPEIANVTALVINVNSDWSGSAILTWGFKTAQGHDDSRTVEISGDQLLQGSVQVLRSPEWPSNVPLAVACRAIALACTHHAIHRCQAAIDDIGMPKV